jgi:hypothetical protein
MKSVYALVTVLTVASSAELFATEKTAFEPELATKAEYEIRKFTQIDRVSPHHAHAL